MGRDGGGGGLREAAVEVVEVVDAGDLALAPDGRTPLTDPTLAYLASLACAGRKVHPLATLCWLVCRSAPAPSPYGDSSAKNLRG